VHYGATPKQEVWRDGRVVMYRFVGEKAPTAKVPLLIAYALVNRPYMVDLQEDRSLVKGLLARGEDVYIIDWGYPDRSDRYLILDDYINRFIGGAVDHLRRESGLDAINLLGICQGGTFSLCYAALHPGKVKNLITMVTPVDFHTAGNMLSNWTQDVDIDLFVDTVGNVSADTMNSTYLMLKPFRLHLQKYVGLLDILDDRNAIEDFLRMEKWIFDSPDLAGEAFRQFTKQFYQGNGFVNGGIEIDGETVDLGFVDMPILNIFAEQDHLVPPDASRALKELAGTDDYTELSFKGGHIGIYVSSRAQREVPTAIHEWLAKRAK
jgi:polyhydroxyalkanoate synthase